VLGCLRFQEGPTVSWKPNSGFTPFATQKWRTKRGRESTFALSVTRKVLPTLPHYVDTSPDAAHCWPTARSMVGPYYFLSVFPSATVPSSTDFLDNPTRDMEGDMSTDVTLFTSVGSTLREASRSIIDLMEEGIVLEEERKRVIEGERTPKRRRIEAEVTPQEEEEEEEEEDDSTESELIHNELDIRRSAASISGALKERQLELPWEQWLHICTYLDVPTLFAFASTCHEFYQIVFTKVTS